MLWFIWKTWHVCSCVLWASVIDFILESNIEDFIQSLKHQNILLEVDDFANRNGTGDLSYNGAIIVSGKQKVCLLLVSCFYFYEKKRQKRSATFLTVLKTASTQLVHSTWFKSIWGSLLNKLWNVSELL